jgi:hypothetical protein
VRKKPWSPVRELLSRPDYDPIQKYSCYLGDPSTGEKIIGYDIHPGKGHHRHVRGQETRYAFRSLEELLDDFADDVQAVLEGKL